MSEKASALEARLKGKLFLGGDAPSAEDVEAFNALLGSGNVNLYRWVKHVASCTEAERRAWGEPQPDLPEESAPSA